MVSHPKTIGSRDNVENVYEKTPFSYLAGLDCTESGRERTLRKYYAWTI